MSSLSSPFSTSDHTLADPTHLIAHLDQCATARGRWHRMHGAFEVVDAFVLPRFMSSLVTLLALALALLWLVP